MILSYTKGTHRLFSVLCFLLCISPINTHNHLWCCTKWEVIWGPVGPIREESWLSTQTLISWGLFIRVWPFTLILLLVTVKSWKIKVLFGDNYSSDVNTQTSKQSKHLVLFSWHCQNGNIITDCAFEAHMQHIMYCIYNWAFSKAFHSFYFRLNHMVVLHSKHKLRFRISI